ncbi:MAG: hypothetical protein AAGB51_00715 [Planctomycetota bacterium]
MGAGGNGIDRVVLLAGGLKPSPLARALGQPAVDLPLVRDSTLFSLWLRAFSGAREVRLVHHRDLPPKAELPEAEGTKISIEADRDDFRGPAGIVRDVTEDLADDALVLVVESARFPSPSAAGMAAAHHQHRADVTLGVNPDRSPAGLFLFRRELIASVAELGFTDLKEQWLGKLIKDGAEVRPHDLETPGCFLIRSAEAALDAARWASELFQSGEHPITDEQPTDAGVRVVQEGAKVDPTARVIDSIVMNGAQVGPGAIVARSILCPGADIPPGAEIVGRIVGGPAQDEPATAEAAWRS